MFSTRITRQQSIFIISEIISGEMCLCIQDLLDFMRLRFRLFLKSVLEEVIFYLKKCLKHIYYILMPFCFKLSRDQMYLNTIFLILDSCVVLEFYIYILVIGFFNYSII